MTSAFCPAHITCFFSPGGAEEALRKGSKGAGIRLSKGTTVHVDERVGKTTVSINGKDDDAPITKHVLEHLSPDRNFDVTVECELPLGQGFGMSASGAIAAALCVSQIVGKTRQDAFESAHIAEVTCGGGLGDVAGLMYEGHQPIRLKEGIPPIGRITGGGGISFDAITLMIADGEMSTSSVLSDDVKVKRICRSGDKALLHYLSNVSKDSLFKMSNRFSQESGVMGERVGDIMQTLAKGGVRSAMCMLGNSLFTDVPQNEVEDLIEDVTLIQTSSTCEPARIIQKE